MTVSVSRADGFGDELLDSISARLAEMPSIDDVIEQRKARDPEFAAHWEATRVARDFAIEVIRFRVKAGMTQEELAEVLWVDANIVRHLEDGEHLEASD